MSEDRKVEDSDRAAYGGLRISLIKIGLFLLCTGLWLLWLFLSAALSWWMLLILAVPVYLGSEWLGEKVFSRKYGWSTEQVGFSPKRIALGVLLVLGLSAGAYLLIRLLT